MDASHHVSTWGVVSFCLAIAFGAIGCEEDEFADAPRAEAPDEPKASGRKAPGGGSKGAAGQAVPSKGSSKSGSLPADHPPIGGPKGAKDGPRPSESPSGSSGSSGGSGSTDGLPVEWEAPEGWKEVRPSSSMRKAQYRLSGGEGGRPATLAVYHFGSRGGGSVQANIDRWVGQFETSDGSSAAEAAETSRERVDGMTIHLVDVAGTYNPGTGMGAGEPKQDHRMLAAIAETERGSVFFKLVGPSATVDAHESEFETFVDSFQVAD